MFGNVKTIALEIHRFPVTTIKRTFYAQKLFSKIRKKGINSNVEYVSSIIATLFRWIVEVYELEEIKTVNFQFQLLSNFVKIFKFSTRKIDFANGNLVIQL